MRYIRNYLFLLIILSFGAQSAKQDLLEPEKAFRFSARVLDAANIEVRYQIADGYYLYRERFAFAAEGGAKLGEARIPEGKKKKDEFFGDVQTHRGELKIVVPVEAAADGKVALNVTSQGCADVGVCYVPMDSKIQLAMAGGAVSGGLPTVRDSGDPLARLMEQGDAPKANTAANTAAATVLAEDSRVASLFQGSFWLLIASFFGFGLLLSFTPCVLPMIPILSGIIVGRGQGVTRAQGFALSAAYVLGFYELQLPAGWQARLNASSNKLPGGRYGGVFAMGALSALIVGPCVAAPLAGALLYISQSRDGMLGGTALFAMALGMGVPLLAVGASAGALLPKAGPWMDAIKRFFGVLLIAVAIYLVSPLIPLAVQMLAWGALLIVSAMLLRAIDALPPQAHSLLRVGKGVGMIALLAGAAYIVGGLSGAKDIFQPLSGLSAAPSGSAPASPAEPLFKRVSTSAELDAALKAATATGKPALLDFYADWCVSCKEMERFTFTDAQVQQRLKDMVKVQADVTANNAEHQALLKRFRLFGPPGIIFFDKNGKEINGLRVIGFQGAEKFTGVLDEVLKF